jgi:hypothetical protein
MISVTESERCKLDKLLFSDCKDEKNIAVEKIPANQVKQVKSLTGLCLFFYNYFP